MAVPLGTAQSDREECPHDCHVGNIGQLSLWHRKVNFVCSKQIIGFRPDLGRIFASN